MKQKTTQTTNNIVPTNQQKQPPTIFTYKTKTKKKQPMKLLLTMDVLVPVLMKNAANRDKWNELQNSVNHQMFECKWHFGVTPRSMSVWVSVFTTYNISMFHKALFYSFHVCEKKSGRGLWSVSKRTCLILETHQTSLWVTRKKGREMMRKKHCVYRVCSFPPHLSLPLSIVLLEKNDAA